MASLPPGFTIDEPPAANKPRPLAFNPETGQPEAPAVKNPLPLAFKVDDGQPAPVEPPAPLDTSPEPSSGWIEGPRQFASGMASGIAGIPDMPFNLVRGVNSILGRMLNG